MFVELLKEFAGNPAGKRIDVDKSHADLLISQGVAKACPDDPLAPIVAKAFGEGMAKMTEGIGQAVAAAVQQLEKRLPPAPAPWVTSGAVGQDSAGYSMLKAAAYTRGYIGADSAKEEIHVHQELRDLYRTYGFLPHYGEHSFLVPFATEHIPALDQKGEKLQREVRQKMIAHQNRFDPDEAAWIAHQIGRAGDASYRSLLKALGTVSDTAGGVLVGFPALGELIELQRNLEVFPLAGAREIALPPNGRIQFPKLTGGSTAHWIGEASSIPESQQTTGNLDLQAKKLALFVKLNNELLRFASPSADGLVRIDMARVAALKADLAMLEGTGGTQVKGLLTYSDLVTHVASTVGANGDTFQPEDVALMEGKLPDAVAEPTAWVMRKNYYSILMNRRADAAVAGDKAGPFLFHPSRISAAEPMPKELYGTKVVRSAQVSNTRSKGASNNLTYVLLGYFPDWIIARMGIMELAMNMYADSAFQNDQTWLRGIQHLDAGARHGASFVLCDTLTVA